MQTSMEKFNRRKARVGYHVRRKAADKPIVYVDRSNQHVHTYLVVGDKTLAAASTNDKGLRAKLKSTRNVDAAKEAGKLLAERAKQAGVSEAVFNRGGYRYHGRVKAVADGAREAGLKL